MFHPAPIRRLAIVVSHPIQYYVPLYRRLAQRSDLVIKVFFTWHAGEAAVQDHGFKQPVSWDIPLTEGYEYELVTNVSSDPGTHRFLGLRNPSLVERVVAWNPDAVHITGWAWQSHLLSIRAFYKKGIPILFRGDSHLLDFPQAGLRWRVKHAVLTRIYSWPTVFLCVGKANCAYYQAFGVGPERLFMCSHSIDVGRFAGPADVFEGEAARWRKDLGLADSQLVLLFAGKFERKKRPLELMQAVQQMNDPKLVLVLVGDGELAGEVHAMAAAEPDRFRVLPFQNQSHMPVVYRLGDLFVLPSAFGETWGLAVNEAMACGRPVLVSDRVGCSADVVDASCGRVFPWADFFAMARVLREMTMYRERLREMGRAAAHRAWMFDISVTETELITSLLQVGAL